MTETWWDIASDPNHIWAELFWTAIFDGVVMWLLYGVVWKKVLLPKLRKQIHEDIDMEHGVTHE